MAKPHLASTQNNHIFTSGATGTNAAVIRGALRFHSFYFTPLKLAPLPFCVCNTSASDHHRPPRLLCAPGAEALRGALQLSAPLAPFSHPPNPTRVGYRACRRASSGAAGAPDRRAAAESHHAAAREPRAPPKGASPLLASAAPPFAAMRIRGPSLLARSAPCPASCDAMNAPESICVCMKP